MCSTKNFELPTTNFFKLLFSYFNMKHNIKISALLLCMFILAQIIGLVVIDGYSSVKIVNGEKTNVTAPVVPFFDNPTLETNSDFVQVLFSILFSFVIVLLLVFILTKYKSETFFRIWFFLVVTLAVSVTLNLAFINFPYSIYFAVILSVILAYFKIYQRNMIVHNLTELMIYPGVAAAFVPLLNPITIIILLILISIYDVWAVWKSGIMQKMAKYQISKIRIFSGFLIPLMTKDQRQKVKNISDKKLKTKTMKINVALLGGGDIVFPIITAGVYLRNFGIASAWFIVAGATLGLSYIFFFGEKKKPYPAMPYITVGILFGLLLWWILF